MKDTIRIVVAGNTGVGKSSIIWQLREHLKDFAFEVDLEVGDDYANEFEFNRYAGYRNNEKMVQLSAKTKIIIEEARINKEIK
jgi:deoxyadenosine/deoxycytidine kinase